MNSFSHCPNLFKNNHFSYIFKIIQERFMIKEKEFILDYGWA